MTSNASSATGAEARSGPRLPLAILLGAYWVFQFVRNGFTEIDKDPFYVASLTAPIFQFIGPGLLLCMALVVIFEFPRLLYRQYRTMLLLMGGMLLLFALSFIANDQSALNAFQFFFGYLQYLILIPFTILFVRDREPNFRVVTKWILIPILVQFALNLGWALKISPLQNSRRWTPNNVDWAYGTLTNCTEAAAMGSVLVFFVLHILIFKPQLPAAFTRKKLLFLGGAGFLMMLWADSKLSYLTLSAATGIIILLTLKMGWTRKILYTATGFSLVVCMFLASLFYNFLFNPIYSSTASYANVVEWTVNGGLVAIDNNPKIQVYHDLTEKLPEEIDFPLFGGGPGNVTSRFAIKAETPLASKYIVPRIDYEYNFRGNSMLLLPNTGFNAILGDLGWPGVILYFGTLILLTGLVFNNFRRERFSGLQATWAFVYLAFTAYFLIHSLVDDKLYLGSEVAFVWILGIILNHSAGRGPETDPGIRRSN